MDKKMEATIQHSFVVRLKFAVVCFNTNSNDPGKAIWGLPQYGMAALETLEI